MFRFLPTFKKHVSMPVHLTVFCFRKKIKTTLETAKGGRNIFPLYAQRTFIDADRGSGSITLITLHLHQTAASHHQLLTRYNCPPPPLTPDDDCVSVKTRVTVAEDQNVKI